MVGRLGTVVAGIVFPLAGVSLPSAHAQDAPLGGTVKELLLGSWAHWDRGSDQPAAVALEACASPMMSQSRRSLLSVRETIEQMPGWGSVSADLSFFEHEGRLFMASANEFGRASAAVFEHLYMSSQDQRAMVIGAHTWDHSPVSGYQVTPTGDSLKSVPLALAVQNGLVTTQQFRLDVGEIDGEFVVTLLTPVTRVSGMTEDTARYVRCGDVTKILE